MSQNKQLKLSTTIKVQDLSSGSTVEYIELFREMLRSGEFDLQLVDVNISLQEEIEASLSRREIKINGIDYSGLI